MSDRRYSIVRAPERGIVVVTVSDELGDDDADSGIKLSFDKGRDSLSVSGWFDQHEYLLSGDVEIPLGEIRAILHEME